MKRGYIYIALAVLMFSSMEVALKLIAGTINPIQLTLTRFAIGFVFLAPLAAYMLKKRGKHLNLPSIAYFALLGFIGIAVCMPIYQMSVRYTDSAVVAVLFSCNPVCTTVLAYFFLREPILPRHLAALAFEILGSILLIRPWAQQLDSTGIQLALLSTLLFALYGVLGKRKCAEYGGAVVTCFSFLFGSIFILLFILLTHIQGVAAWFTSLGLDICANVPLMAGYTLENLPVVLYVSVGVAGIGFCAYFLAMEYQPASVVALVYFFKPAISPVLAWLIHKEEISPNMLAGILCIVVGSLCAILPGVLESRREQRLHS